MNVSIQSRETLLDFRQPLIYDKCFVFRMIIFRSNRYHVVLFFTSKGAPITLNVIRNLYEEIYHVKCEYLQIILEKGNLNFNVSPSKEIQSNRFSNT